MSPPWLSVPLRKKLIAGRFHSRSAFRVLFDQVDKQFAGLNSRKKARTGISEQALNELIQMKPSAKLSITKVLQPVTDKLLALLVRFIFSFSTRSDVGLA
jgi:hypothetical protein